MAGVTRQIDKSQVMKRNNIPKDKPFREPQATLVVSGTVAGDVVCKNIKAWRTQKTIIQAESTIVIEKEIIGSDQHIDLEELEVCMKKSHVPDELMLLSGRQVFIGTKDENTSTASKHIFVKAEKFFLHNTSILGCIDVVLGEDLFRMKRKYQLEPQKLEKRIRVLNNEMVFDVEDFQTKSRRPGNEAIKPFCEKLVSAMQVSKYPENKKIAVALLNRVMTDLRIVNKTETIERWQRKFDYENELSDMTKKLDLLYKKLNTMALVLKLHKIKNGAKLVIYYDREQHVIKGPLDRQDFIIKHKLSDDLETGLKKSTLEINEQ